MLVLSRHLGEMIIFPGLGVSIDVLRWHGTLTQLSVHTSECIERIWLDLSPTGNHSIGDDEVAPLCEISTSKKRHAFQNQLNHLTLKLELLKRQLEAGRVQSPERVLSDAISEFTLLESGIDDDAAIYGTATRRRVLVVEDSHAERESLASCLQRLGFEVDIASHEVAAIEFLGNHDLPEIVLLDMESPGISGRMLTTALRCDDRLKDLRVFAVSDSLKEKLPSNDLIVNGWFPRPLRLDAVLHVINEAHLG